MRELMASPVTTISSGRSFCTGCRTNFSSISAFDLHHREAEDGSVECLDPATLVTKSGDPLLVWDKERHLWKRTSQDPNWVQKRREAL